jgi:hypothetical protein
MKQFKIHATSRVGLDSVVEQKSNYERRGFVASSLGKIRCMSHRLSLRPDLVTASVHDSKLTGLHLVDVKEIQHGILSQSDCDHTGFKRDCLWRDGIINREDFFGLALVEDEKSIAEDSVHGWVAVRRASEGYRLGPVYARNTVASRTLIMAAMQATAARASTFTEHGIQTLSVFSKSWDGIAPVLTTIACGSVVMRLRSKEKVVWRIVGCSQSSMRCSDDLDR